VLTGEPEHQEAPVNPVELATQNTAPTAEAAASSIEEGPRGEARFPDLTSKPTRRVDLAKLLQVVALLPVLVILKLVVESSNLQWFDYWTVFPRFVNPDGSLAERGLFGLHEGHSLFMSGVIQWLNYKITGGLNRPLGLFVIVVVLAQLLLLRKLLPPSTRIGQWWFSGLFVATAALLFAPQGAHNFSRAASGSAWLTANLFGIAAIFASTRRRGILVAVPLGVLATLTYGTGLAVWPTLIVVSAARSRWSRGHSALTAAGIVAVVLYFLAYDRPASQSAPEFDPNDMARRTVQVIGSALVSDAAVAVLAGTVGLALAAYLFVRAARENRSLAAPWMGLALYGVVAALMIGAARGGVNGDDIGVASRYFSLSAMTWCAVLVLAVIVWGRSARLALGVAVVAVLAFVGGGPALNNVRASVPKQDELAIALRLGLSENYPFFWGASRYEEFYERIGHYPFTDDFTADCGLLGSRLDRGRVAEPDGESRGHIDGFQPAYNDESVRIAGWFGSESGSVRCIVVTDQSLTVVGAGAYGIERGDLVMAGGAPGGNFKAGFVAVAPEGAQRYRVFALLDGDSTAYEVTGEELVAS
jgi:hypothetical protein